MLAMLRQLTSFGDEVRGRWLSAHERAWCWSVKCALVCSSRGRRMFSDFLAPDCCECLGCRTVSGPSLAKPKIHRENAYPRTAANVVVKAWMAVSKSIAGGMSREPHLAQTSYSVRERPSASRD